MPQHRSSFLSLASITLSLTQSMDTYPTSDIPSPVTQPTPATQESQMEMTIIIQKQPSVGRGISLFIAH